MAPPAGTIAQEVLMGLARVIVVGSALLAAVTVVPAVASPAGSGLTASLPHAGGDVTLPELEAIFGPVGDREATVTGLPGLNEEMRRGAITSPARKAAFLATLRHESGFRYNAVQNGTYAYRGRGFIQLTGAFNYRGAGAWRGVDLLRRPELAASVEHSAPIARWYWTVARNINPAADALDMAAVNVAIGYPASRREDEQRCADFAKALDYYTEGPAPDGINCTRGATEASSRTYPPSP
ncbi:MAG: hypothetical protein GEV11_16850 [Streptosporangiales bacterium]|nr:hypothetical protein [Streptosporangiales bacterium]